MPNEDQAKYWQGKGGEHWVSERDRYARMVAGFGDAVVEAASLSPGDRVLDVGCGMGPTTFAAADRVGPSGEVVGVDLSGPMLGVARERAEEAGLAHVRFEQADAQVHSFEPDTFDAAISRFGVMFFDDPKAAFANIAAALRRGGRLAFVCWQPLFENEWIMVPVAAALEHVPLPEMGEPGAPGPFAFAEQGRVEDILGSAGFKNISLEPLELPMRVGSDADDFVAFAKTSDFADTLMEGVDDATAAAAWASVREALGSYAGPDGVVLSGKTWLVTAIRP
ncbi:MAG: methyltransferase domain-containing protein [Actinobacteria bacterium]|nr:methyltransferase domain-containing protein [Actinomycetota bacterium]